MLVYDGQEWNVGGTAAVKAVDWGEDDRAASVTGDCETCGCCPVRHSLSWALCLACVSMVVYELTHVINEMR